VNPDIAVQSTQAKVPLSILIVDRDQDTRLMYRTALEAITASVAEADDGAEALGIALSAQPNVVITETRLQRVDGFALCSLLRAAPATQSAGIIVVTADARPDDTLRATRAGADEVLIKPCDLETVVEAVLRLWERNQLGAARTNPDGGEPRGDGDARRTPKVHRRQRFVTTQPPRHPPELRCPQCDRVLQYYRSHVGGVNDDHPEQWDYYVCAGGCGTFQYRQRTRSIRHITELTDAEPNPIDRRSKGA
jgi:CheY-like chemotaxis protein